MATDIALAVGVIDPRRRAACRPRLRAFLLGLAVVDDIGAIVVIAIFYSDGVSFAWLAVGVPLRSLALILVVRRWRRLQQPCPSTSRSAPLLWFALHEAGVHPTHRRRGRDGAAHPGGAAPVASTWWTSRN
jgi:NhaA family Na+:H+ antiporter